VSYPIQIYLAGTFSFGSGKYQGRWKAMTDTERKVADAVRHRLDSYHYVGSEVKARQLREANERIFLDSGAFSAHTLGVDLSIAEYCDFILRNDDIIRKEDGILMASVLDGIGDPLLTYRNQLEMEARGVRPLPCFHANEDERYLEYYVANYEYITLGGMVGGSTKQLMTWLDRMWGRYLLDGAGNPKVRVHGFGITAVPLMERYPWYSCDSSSWIQAAAFGAIIIPGYGNLDVSAESPKNHVRGEHISTLTEIEYERVKQIVESGGHGLTIEDITQRYLGRATYNQWAFSAIEDTLNEQKARVGHPKLPMELF
jgi:hypothetical protein